MEFKVETHEQYGKSFDTKQIKPDEHMEFTLLFDEPLTGEKIFKDEKGNERPWKWRKFSVNLHHPEEHENISFFAKGQSPVSGKNFGELLESGFKTGNRVKCVKTLYETKRGWFETWSVEGVAAPREKSVEEKLSDVGKAKFGNDLTKEMLGEKIHVKDAPLLDRIWGYYTK